MSDKATESTEVRKRWRVAAQGGGVAATTLTLVGLIPETIPVPVRIGIGIAALSALIAAWVSGQKIDRARRAGQHEISRLKEELGSIGGLGVRTPDEALRLLQAQLFRDGTMWRLTVYVLERRGADFSLVRKLRCASSELYEESGRDVLSLNQSLFRELKTLGLPFASESSEGPDREAAPEEWRNWQLQVVRDEKVVAEMRMPSRKYAWCAVRESGGGRTVALMAESVQTDGIDSSLLKSPLMAPLLTLIVDLSELPQAVRPVVTNAVDVLERMI